MKKAKNKFLISLKYIFVVLLLLIGAFLYIQIYMIVTIFHPPNDVITYRYYNEAHEQYLIIFSDKKMFCTYFGNDGVVDSATYTIKGEFGNKIIGKLYYLENFDGLVLNDYIWAKDNMRPAYLELRLESRELDGALYSVWYDSHNITIQINDEYLLYGEILFEKVDYSIYG